MQQETSPLLVEMVNSATKGEGVRVPRRVFRAVTPARCHPLPETDTQPSIVRLQMPPGDAVTTGDGGASLRSVPTGAWGLRPARDHFWGQPREAGAAGQRAQRGARLFCQVFCSDEQPA